MPMPARPFARPVSSLFPHDPTGPRPHRHRAARLALAAAVAIVTAPATAAEPPCDWERQLVDGNGVDLFGAANDLAGGVWVAGSSRTTTTPFRTLNFVARWTGDAWATVSVPQPAPADSDQALRAVVALAPDDAIIVGGIDDPDGSPQTQPQAHRWDGTSWTTLASPSFIGGGFYAAAARTGDTVWATGGKNDDEPYDAVVEPFASRLDGDAWETFVLPPFEIVGTQSLARYRLRAIDGVAADDVWIGGWLLEVGGPIHDAVLVHGDGTDWTWSDVRPLLANPGAGSSIEAIAAIATDDVWAVGHEFDLATGRDVALLLHWNGTAWSRIDAPTEDGRNVRLRDVVARSSGDVFAAGSATTPGTWPEGYLLHYDGTTWSRVDDVETADGSQFFAATTSTDGTLWLAGIANEFPAVGLAQRALACTPSCPADVDGSGAVDFGDVLAVLAAWGSTDADADLNDDGSVDFTDLLAVLSAFGDCG